MRKLVCRVGLYGLSTPYVCDAFVYPKFTLLRKVAPL